MHAISLPRRKNTAEKAAYPLQKKTVYLSWQKGSLSLLPIKMAAYPKKEKQERKQIKKKKEEAEEEQKINKQYMMNIKNNK